MAEKRAAAAIVVLAMLAGCVTPPRLAGPAAMQGAAALGFPAFVRANGDNERSLEGSDAARHGLASDGGFEVLALSGGGAGGAYGAGALVGLTRANARPEFEIVTGVSAGALVAPFAFLGPTWDAALEDAFTNEMAERILRPRGLSALARPGLFVGEELRDMVERFLTPELLDAIARESRRGRLLLVQTTNLDSQQAVIWNIGAIAEQGGAPARGLIRDVLVASSSVPGVFPPVMVNVDAQGRPAQEMHVDGGVAAPFFIARDLVPVWRARAARARTARLYVIINGRLDNRMGATPLNTLPIVARSFETNQMHQARAALANSAAFAETQGLQFHFTRIPPDSDYDGPLVFSNGNMRRLFDRGVDEAQNGRLWLGAAALPRAGGGPIAAR